MQLKEKLSSYFESSKRYINPFTVGGLVLIIWMITSRTGYLPQHGLRLTNRNNNNEDDDEDETEGKHSWNVNQAIIVATTVILSYFLLRYVNPSTTLQTAGGFKLPEGASILMPSDINQSSSRATSSQRQHQPEVGNILTGTPPF